MRALEHRCRVGRSGSFFSNDTCPPLGASALKTAEHSHTPLKSQGQSDLSGLWGCVVCVVLERTGTLRRGGGRGKREKGRVGKGKRKGEGRRERGRKRKKREKGGFSHGLSWQNPYLAEGGGMKQTSNAPESMSPGATLLTFPEIPKGLPLRSDTSVLLPETLPRSRPRLPRWPCSPWSPQDLKFPDRQRGLKGNEFRGTRSSGPALGILGNAPC